MFQQQLGPTASLHSWEPYKPHFFLAPRDYWNLSPPNGCLRAELMSSAGPLLAPGSHTPPCPINFKCYSYPRPPLLFISLLPPSFHHHLGAPSPISALSWLILSCNWTEVSGDGRQHAPVPRVPSLEWKHARPWSISSAPRQSNIPCSKFQWAEWLDLTLKQNVFSKWSKNGPTSRRDAHPYNFIWATPKLKLTAKSQCEEISFKASRSTFTKFNQFNFSKCR